VSPDRTGQRTAAWLPEAGSEAREWVDLALELCDAADRVSMAHFQRDLRIEAKPDRSFVTQADTQIERALRERIRAAYPDHGLVGEEYGEETSASGVRWFIDPIDGTHNFMRGIPVFATLLGLEVDGEMVVGAVSAPALGARWYAWQGGGAWALHANAAATSEAARSDAATSAATPPQRMQVSSVARLEDAQLLYSSPTDLAASGLVPGLQATLGRVWRERGFGDFWGYTLVAAGAAEGMIEAGMNSWDLAPMEVLLAEAGGQLTDLEGVPGIHGSGALASNGILHEELLRSLRG
jgi:histidinol-phosphatase